MNNFLKKLCCISLLVHFWAIMLPWLLLYCSMFFLSKRRLYFIKCFFRIYWDNPMLFIVQFVNVMHLMYWFEYFKPSRHSRDNSCLVQVNGLSEVVGFNYSVCYCGFLHLCSSGILVILPFCCTLFCFVVKVMLTL